MEFIVKRLAGSHTFTRYNVYIVTLFGFFIFHGDTRLVSLADSVLLWNTGSFHEFSLRANLGEGIERDVIIDMLHAALLLPLAMVGVLPDLTAAQSNGGSQVMIDTLRSHEATLYFGKLKDWTIILASVVLLSKQVIITPSKEYLGRRNFVLVLLSSPFFFLTIVALNAIEPFSILALAIVFRTMRGRRHVIHGAGLALLAIVQPALLLVALPLTLWAQNFSAMTIIAAAFFAFLYVLSLPYALITGDYGVAGHVGDVNNAVVRLLEASEIGFLLAFFGCLLASAALYCFPNAKINITRLAVAILGSVVVIALATGLWTIQELLLVMMVLSFVVILTRPTKKFFYVEILMFLASLGLFSTAWTDWSAQLFLRVASTEYLPTILMAEQLAPTGLTGLVWLTVMTTLFLVLVLQVFGPTKFKLAQYVDVDQNIYKLRYSASGYLFFAVAFCA